MYSENELSKLVVNCCFQINSQLGPGLLESVYEEILFYELLKKDLYVERQKPIHVYWDEKKLELGFRADIIVEDKIILELKSIDLLAPVHYKQVLTYMKLTNLKPGLPINFNEALIKDGIHRIVNQLDE